MSITVAMLGKTVPEPTSERIKHYVCSAGYSKEYGMVRLYPCERWSVPSRWIVSRVAVERHPRDSRPETWSPTSSLFKPFAQIKKCLDILEPNLVSGIVESNERRMSLAVVRPIEPRFVLEASNSNEPTYELYEEGVALKARERFAYVPRLRFATEDGKQHDLQMRDWGVWELIRKNHEKLAGMSAEDRCQWVGNSLRIKEDTHFLIGNYANYRTSWCVISSLNVS